MQWMVGMLLFWISMVSNAQALAEIVPTRSVTHILVAGNSLTHVANLPAVFKALAEANGKAVNIEFLVRGGATLREHLDAGRLVDEIDSGRFDVLILQERGGDLLCDFGSMLERASLHGPFVDAKCADALRVHRALAWRFYQASIPALPLSRRLILQGTYQPNEMVSKQLEESEAQLADAIGASHCAMSEDLRIARRQFPAIQWAAPDGMHPSENSALLQSILLFRAVFGLWPKPNAISVYAPIFAANARFDLTRLVSEQSISAGKHEHHYDQKFVADLVAFLSARDKQH